MWDLQESDVVIVGAGLAGLRCASVLEHAGLSVTVLEASDAVGGRVRTDVIDGFRCDRGFQVLNPSYPQVKSAIDIDALDLKKFHPLGVYVKALVLSDGGDMDTAFDLLSTAITEKASELKPLRLLGKLYFERKKYDDAARIYERCRELDPFDTSWLATLARVYKQGGKDDKLLGVLKELADATPDDLATRKQIAAMEQKAGNQAEVEKYARQALEIDVLDKAAQTLFLDALTAQGKNAEEKTWRKLLEP